MKKYIIPLKSTDLRFLIRTGYDETAELLNNKLNKLKEQTKTCYYGQQPQEGTAMDRSAFNFYRRNEITK